MKMKYTMMIVLPTLAALMVTSCEMIRECNTNDLHPDNVRSDCDPYIVKSVHDLDIVTSDPNLDIVKSDPNPDTVSSDRGLDIVKSDPNHDTVSSDPNPDTVSSDPNPDTVTSDRDIDIVKSDPNPDTVSSDPNPDTVTSDRNLDIVKSDPKFDTVSSDRDLDIVKSDPNIDNVTSDRDLDIVKSDPNLDTVTSDRDLDITIVQGCDKGSSNDLDIESKHDKQIDTDENIHTEQMNTYDPHHHCPRHHHHCPWHPPMDIVIAKYPGLLHTKQEIEAMETEMFQNRNQMLPGLLQSDNDNCCPTNIKHRFNVTTMVNLNSVIKTIINFPEEDMYQLIPRADECRPVGCSDCQMQNVILALLVEADNYQNMAFDNFYTPMYCSCKRLR